MTKYQFLHMSRRELFRLGGTAFVASGATLRGQPASAQQRALFCGEGVIPVAEEQIGIGVGSEPVPLSPLILDPFVENLPVPSALAPVSDLSGWATPPSKQQQDSNNDGGHQVPGATSSPAAPRFRTFTRSHCRWASIESPTVACRRCSSPMAWAPGQSTM